MKAEIIANNEGIELFAETEEDKVRLKELKDNIKRGGRQIYAELSNGDWNYQALFYCHR